MNFGNSFYSQNGRGGPAPAATENDGFARISIVFAVLSIVCLMYYRVMIPMSLIAIGMGILGVRSNYRKRAIVAITIGVIMLLTGMVFTVTIAALTPYMDELVNVFYSGLQ